MITLEVLGSVIDTTPHYHELPKWVHTNRRGARHVVRVRTDDAVAAAANAAECSRRADSTSDDVVGVDVDRRRRALSRRINYPLLQRPP
ncbi:hypothetical protein V9T40_009219 [Parthenolecanium corni]|uniref:Uncharacterized protein n=1 Tax=Parthenolecanium corni TaxID=536013 RepID=A0AAN9U0S4_9HEMI